MMEDVKKEIMSESDSEIIDLTSEIPQIIIPTPLVSSNTSGFHSATPTPSQIKSSRVSETAALATQTPKPSPESSSKNQESVFKNILKRLSQLEKNASSLNIYTKDSLESVKNEISSLRETEVSQLRNHWIEILETQVCAF